MPAAAREGSGALKENLRRRMGAWARRRQGDDRLPIIISTRRVYIVPTRAGLAFAARRRAKLATVTGSDSE